MHRESHVPHQTLELLADVLLAASEPDTERPTYDERRLARRARLAYRAELYFLAASTHAPMPDADKDALPEAVSLSTDEASALRMCRDGWTMARIADEMGITRQKARRLVRNALCRGGKQQGQLDGLTGVYRAETGRHGYHQPMHCGAEPCRKLGYCRYAFKGTRSAG